MKRISLAKRVGTTALCAVLSAGLVSAGAAQSTQVSAYLSPDLTIVVDGTARDFYSAGGNETHPVLYDGTTYLPVRAIGELMGKTVTWDAATLTVSLHGVLNGAPTTGTPDTGAVPHTVPAKLRPEVGILVDGVQRTFTTSSGAAVYPLFYNNSLYLPVRNIGELMNKEVHWDSASRTVTLGKDSGTSTNLIGTEAAKAKALAHARLQATQVTFLQCDLEWDDGRRVYDVEFYTKDGKEFDYTVDAYTGAVLSFDYDAEHSNQGGSNTPATLIGKDAAKAKALAHAKLQATQVTFLQCELEWDDGRRVYDVEFYTKDGKEFDYTIDAYTGAILSFDYDAEHSNQGGSNTPATLIGKDAAKAKALAHAGLQASQVTFTQCELDRDDGRQVYEIEFWAQNHREYEYEIDAYTGAVLSFSSESLYDD